MYPKVKVVLPLKWASVRLMLWLGILNLICGWLSSETWAFSVIYA